MVLTTTQALALGLFIWEEVISVSEIRPVMKQYEKLNCVYMRSGKSIPGTEISFADRRDLGDGDNFCAI